MKKPTYKLNNEGYATTWLVSGRLDTLIDPTTRTIVDQGEYERYLKTAIYDSSMKSAPTDIGAGKEGLPGLPWSFYPTGPNAFVDLSKFYYVIYKCEFWCATSIVSPFSQEVEADIWSYPAFDSWLNGEPLCSRSFCQKMPMRRHRVTLSLKEGENIFFLRAQNDCIRDTRNIIALSFPNAPDISLTYPGEYNAELFAKREAVDWLYSLSWNGKKITAPHEAPSGCTVTVNGMSVSGRELTVAENAREARIKASFSDYTAERRLEINERILPEKRVSFPSVKEARMDFFRRLAEREVPDDRDDPQFFYTTYIRLLHGLPLSNNDLRIIRLALSDADEQKDCSDFRMSYILASVIKGLLPDYLVEEVHRTAIKYSYWMDEKGVGAMCYNSENHSLLFHCCQMLAGRLWQDETFLRSGRTGREQEVLALKKIDAWLTKIESDGFKEFLSGSYLPITAAAMLLVIDFAEESLSARCSALLDGMFYSLADNTFDGIVYGPQGRVYRGVITPWTAGTQALIFLATGSSVPGGRGALGSWLSAFADTKYEIPDDLEARINSTGMHYGKAEGTVIQTYKGKHFMLTSLPLKTENGVSAGALRPGAKGYQQHLSYATLGGACTVYPQHPGGPYDGVAIRPGYWFGNGYMPAQSQWDNVLGQVFRISDEHPIKFTHLYFPTRCFDSWEQDGSWLFAKKGDGYIAVWCSSRLSLYDGDITQGCDFRAENGSAAYLTVCGDTEALGDYEAFKRYARGFLPEFDRESLTLSIHGGQRVGGEFERP